MAASTQPNPPILEAGKWRLLTPPVDENEKVEIGVLEVHPSLQLHRVAYSTRARSSRNQDLGKARVAIHDFDQNGDSRNSNGNIIAMFTLRELNRAINEFRTRSVAASATTHQQLSQDDMLHSLTATPPSAIPYTVQMLGAIQNITFLTRDAIRCRLPPGYVRDQEKSCSSMQKLLIGFRRCIVVVSIFHTKHQTETYAKGLQVMAYIGPDDLDEWEQNEKARKRQPSSFPIPISENILAYGCYDGGIRFYDIVRRRQGRCSCSVSIF